VFTKVGIPSTPFIWASCWDEMVETNLRRGMMMSQGDITPLFTKPICVVFCCWRCSPSPGCSGERPQA
jgi:putative tricarboxylic transport membrane protein